MKLVIPSYKGNSIIGQPVSVNGNVGAVRCGRLVTQTVVTPSIKNSPLIRARSKGGSWVWSQTGPTSFVTEKEPIQTEVGPSIPGILLVESKYSLIKYGLKAHYGYWDKNEAQ